MNRLGGNGGTGFYYQACRGGRNHFFFACHTLGKPGKLKPRKECRLTGRFTAGSRTVVREPALLTMMKFDQDRPVLAEETTLQVYLLPEVDFEAGLRFQRRLHYEISGDRSQSALVLCEHPPLITVGRQGSRAHILCEAQELRARRWPVRWVNRGGGTLLHLPAHLPLYPLFPLDRFALGLEDYLQRLYAAALSLLADFDSQVPILPDLPGILVSRLFFP